MKYTRSPVTLISGITVDADIDMKGYGLSDLGATLLKSGGYIRLEDSLAANLAWSGLVFVGTAGQNLAKFQTVYRKDDNKYWLAKANSADTMPVIAMAVEAILANATGLFLLIGWVRNDAWSLTAGKPAYQSAATGGVVTTTIPAGSGNQIQKVGIALTTKIAHFNPIYTQFEVT